MISYPITTDFPNSYNNTVNELFNGNIAETYWRSSSDNVLRKYSYAYDDLNRLKEAFYQKPESNIEQRNSYNESLKYDKNGNIERLERTGDYDGDLNPHLIDELDYIYKEESNILLKVTDNTNSLLGFKDDIDDINDEEEDYEYDANGNMTADQNKGITKIIYNHLNLPIFIEFNAIAQSISYFYNANGVKLRKVVNRGAPNYNLTTTDYLGGFQYKNSELQFFPHPEGYVNKYKDRFSYVYNYTDHLGNIRLSYGMDPENNVLKILEENHYYPFGLKHTNYSNDVKTFTSEVSLLTALEEYKIKQIPGGEKLEYMYKYNGKEWQYELGLNVTSMDFRMYDNALGRFHNIDAMTEIMPSLSPYRFAFNNPVIWKDPTGLSEESELPVIALKEVVVRAKARSTKSVHDSGLPQIHSYGFMPKNYKGVSTDYYNKKYGTDFKNLDDWYYRTKYLPFKLDMINSMHSAQAKAGQAIMLLVGSVFAAPILIASSPAAISAVSTTISNPMVQTSLANGIVHAGLQQAITGNIDYADALIAGAPGGPVVQALKPGGMALFDVTNSGGLVTTLDGSKNITSTIRDAATGYIMFRLGSGVSDGNSLNSFGKVPLNGVLNTGDILMNDILKQDGIK